MSTLDLDHIASAMSAELEDILPWQVLDRQSPDYGATINPAWGTDDPSTAFGTPLLVACGFLYLHGGTAALAKSTLLNHLAAGVEYLLRVQRPTGYTDLKNYLPDSAADTGFVLQPVCMLIELGRPLAKVDAAVAEILSRLELFARKAAAALPAGGFGTPNHRWVVTSAMAHAMALFPDLNLAPAIDAIVAEGVDNDREGFYMERSVGVYDAVSNRSLLLLADFYPKAAAEARTAAKRNLELDLHLLHADLTAETSLSHRQDHGKREIPSAQGAAYLHSCLIEPNPVFAEAAERLWYSADRRSAYLAIAYYYLFRKFGQPALPRADLPSSYARWMPDNGLWRIRRGRLSASVVRGDTAIMSLVFGQAELAAVKICSTYYGTGRFRADAMTVDDRTATLTFKGDYRAYRPGAYMPLGRPIGTSIKSFYSEIAAQRQLRSQPKCVSTLRITEVASGFDLHYTNTAALPNVCTQITFDFAPGGVWQTADTAAKPRAGDELFLRHGAGRMIYGSDVIEVGPGGAAHQMWQMRDSELASHSVRITIALVTPVDQVFALRCFRGLNSPPAVPSDSLGRIPDR